MLVSPAVDSGGACSGVLFAGADPDADVVVALGDCVQQDKTRRDKNKTRRGAARRGGEEGQG